MLEHDGFNNTNEITISIFVYEIRFYLIYPFLLEFRYLTWKLLLVPLLVFILFNQEQKIFVIINLVFLLFFLKILLLYFRARRCWTKKRGGHKYILMVKYVFCEKKKFNSILLLLIIISCVCVCGDGDELKIKYIS